ncbi:hypothetical protein HORIV_32440 [Vreelandella olivaria]|uniref:Uncharacterized protein n=1 Tax=Vreelandella olivaria TaxID=390919 RepID=A0ABN5WW12_9GAMM|nr:hypothetical protein HORIV_32440 [Halomonas olivaria]
MTANESSQVSSSAHGAKTLCANDMAASQVNGVWKPLAKYYCLIAMYQHTIL